MQIAVTIPDGDRLYKGDGRIGCIAVITADSSELSLIGASLRFVFAARIPGGYQHLLTLTRSLGQITVTSETATELTANFDIPPSATASLVLGAQGRTGQWDFEVTPVEGFPLTAQRSLLIALPTPESSTGTVQPSIMELHLSDSNPHPQYLRGDEITEAIAAHNSNLAAHPELSGGSVAQLRDAFVPTIGQTIFTLATTPVMPHLSQAFLNAGKAKYGVDYIINGLLLNWMGLDLDSSDRLEIYYL